MATTRSMAAAEAAINSGALQPAANGSATSSVQQPAAATQAIEPLHLSELNQRSANLGCWEVGVFNPCIEDFGWTDKNTGQQKQGTAYRCYLISCRNPSQYVAAQQLMRNGNRNALDRVYQRLKANTCFRMSNVQLNGNTQQEFMNTPQKFVVLIPGTKFDPLLNSNTNQIVQPEPSMTLREIKDLTQRQRFDVTALVKSISEVRKATQERSVVDIVLMDESSTEKTVQQLKWCYWMNTIPSAEQNTHMKMFRESESQGKPLSFFALDGKKLKVGT